MFGRLADNLKLADYSVLPVILTQEGLVAVRRILLYPLNCVPNVK
jgi:hypothetical protein